MPTFGTPNAVIHHDPNFVNIEIEIDPHKSLDLMDIKEIYAAFFRDYLKRKIQEMKPDDVIKLGYYVGKEYQ